MFQLGYLLRVAVAVEKWSFPQVDHSEQVTTDFFHSDFPLTRSP